MNKNQARAIVKNWPDNFKNMVRADVARLVEMREAGSGATSAKISAKTSFILEKCFRSGTGIAPEKILELL